MTPPDTGPRAVMTKTSRRDALRPESDVDLFSDEHLSNPYPDYAALREIGAAVYMSRYDVWAVTRYAEARQILSNWRAFTSTQGVSVGKEFVPFFENSALYADPPEHERLRKVLSDRLSTKALATLTTEIQRRADEIVAAQVARGEFDAIADIAQVFPVTLVADLIGLPQQGRDGLLERASAAFNFFGPANSRAMGSMELFQAVYQYVSEYASRDRVTPDGFAMTIYHAVDQGELNEAEALSLMLAYTIAGIDTTVNGLGSAIWLLATHPDQWAQLRARPELADQAFEEVLRIESPITGFVRTARTDCRVGDSDLRAGDRLLILFAAANHDERHWNQPDHFDITRKPGGHLGFGHGLHACAGRGLARLEGRSLLLALARQIESIQASTPVRRLNNVIRGLEHLPVTVTPEVHAAA